MKQKLSVEVVLMCVMKWSKEMPPWDRGGNNISADNVKPENRSAELKERSRAIDSQLGYISLYEVKLNFRI